ncbi:hypothetical protein FQN57_007369 [Myotisia sp. PD_48]|nr:hypothetical protein FQN57_007369 [Myotisia sp. PD_48]
MARSNSTRKQRQACDRCHSLKLRCTTTTDNQSCARCTRASAQCVYSPSMRGLRPQARERELRRLEDAAPGNNSILNLDVLEYVDASDNFLGTGPEIHPNEFDLVGTIDYDWQPDLQNFVHAEPFVSDIQVLHGQQQNHNSGFNSGVYTTISNDQSMQLDSHIEPASVDEPLLTLTNGIPSTLHPFHSTPNHDHPANLNPSTSASTLNSTSTRSIKKQLIEIFSQVEEQLELIPPLYDHPEEYDTALKTAMIAGRPIWNMAMAFEVTQSLTDIYPKLYSSEFDKSEAPMPLETSSGPSGQSSISAKGQNATTTFDCASIFLAISCYHQILDMWQSVFLHVEKGCAAGRFARERINDPCPCKRLRIGGFVPATKVPMELVLALECQKVLLDQTKDLERRLALAGEMLNNNEPEASSIKTSTVGTGSLVSKCERILQHARQVYSRLEKEASVVTDVSSKVQN